MTLEDALNVDKIREIEAALDGKKLRGHLKPPKALRPYYDGHQTVGGKCIISDGKKYIVAEYGSWNELHPLFERFRIENKDDWIPFDLVDLKW